MVPRGLNFQTAEDKSFELMIMNEIAKNNDAVRALDLR